MRFALFLGCKIPYFVPDYEIATRRVMAELGVELVDLEFSCCGYPMRHLYYFTHLMGAAKALAQAEAAGLDLVTPCKCCFGSFKRAIHRLEIDPAARAEVCRELGRQGLSYSGKAQIKHVLEVLYHEVGTEVIGSRVVRPLTGLKVAGLHGCHAYRPSRITHFDDTRNPVMLDGLIEVTGAQSVYWAGRFSCCGSPLKGFDDAVSMGMIQARLREVAEAQAHVLCLSCSYSRMQADRAHDAAGPQGAADLPGSVLYPQLLGLSLGLSPAELGLGQGHSQARAQHFDLWRQALPRELSAA